MKRGRPKDVPINDSDEICEIGLEAYQKFNTFSNQNNYYRSSKKSRDGELREQRKALKYIKGSAEAGNGWGMYEYARLFVKAGKPPDLHDPKYTGWRDLKNGSEVLFDMIFYEYAETERNIWYQKVLESDHDYAKGLCHLNGCRTPINIDTAILYFNKAYEKHKNLRACVALSDIYANRIYASPTDLLWAWRWNERSLHLKNMGRPYHSRYKHFDRHENTRRAIWCLLWIIKIPNNIILNFVPRDIVLIICRILWTTADHPFWEMTLTMPQLAQLYIDFKKTKKKDLNFN